jgi:hypothetical protein
MFNKSWAPLLFFVVVLARNYIRPLFAQFGEMMKSLDDRRVNRAMKNWFDFSPSPECKEPRGHAVLMFPLPPSPMITQPSLVTFFSQPPIFSTLDAPNFQIKNENSLCVY